MKSVLSSFCFFMAVVAFTSGYQFNTDPSVNADSGLLTYLLSLPPAPTLYLCGSIFLLVSIYLLPGSSREKQAETRSYRYRPSYKPDEIETLEQELTRLKERYSQLIAADEFTMQQFKKDNPRVSSELRIRELIKFSADRLKDEIAYKEINLASAKKNVKK